MTLYDRIDAIARRIEARKLDAETPMDGLSKSLFEFDEWCAQHPEEWENMKNGNGRKNYENDF